MKMRHMRKENSPSVYQARVAAARMRRGRPPEVLWYEAGREAKRCATTPPKAKAESTAPVSKTPHP